MNFSSFNWLLWFYVNLVYVILKPWIYTKICITAMFIWNSNDFGRKWKQDAEFYFIYLFRMLNFILFI